MCIYFPQVSNLSACFINEVSDNITSYRMHIAVVSRPLGLQHEMAVTFGKEMIQLISNR